MSCMGAPSARPYFAMCAVATKLRNLMLFNFLAARKRMCFTSCMRLLGVSHLSFFLVCCTGLHFQMTKNGIFKVAWGNHCRAKRSPLTYFLFSLKNGTNKWGKAHSSGLEHHTCTQADPRFNPSHCQLKSLKWKLTCSTVGRQRSQYWPRSISHVQHFCSTTA